MRNLAHKQKKGSQKLSAEEYRLIANSSESQNLTDIANWLPQRIQNIHALYKKLKSENPNDLAIEIPDSIWTKLKKLSTRQKPAKTSFLSSSKNDEYYRDCCNRVAQVVYQLEEMLITVIDSWKKPERFLNRSKPAECLVTKINNQREYEFIFQIALTLKEIYEKYPDEHELLFAHKKDLFSFIENIGPQKPTVKPKHHGSF